MSFHVGANLRLLEEGWQTDQYRREEIHDKIRRHIAAGYTQNETARIVGCSSRTVSRLVGPKHQTSHKCNRPTLTISAYPKGSPCQQLVAGDGKEPCRFHR